jgi:threonine dehydrogenase-like Zn-dependent dehydrogenase
MKGYAVVGYNKADWVEAKYPVCGPMDAVCRPIALSFCTSDVHWVEDEDGTHHHGLIMGHEGVGEIVEVGSLVRDFKPGDRVIVPAVTPNWSDVASQAGYSVHSGGLFGGLAFAKKGGMFAEFFHVNDADGNLARLPEGMDPGTACMVSDMMPTGFHGCELAEVGFGDSVCVIGIGPVGLMAVRAAVLRGAARVFGVGTRPDCVRVAREYGATDILNYRNGPLDRQIHALTGKKGVDRVIIAGGDNETFEEAVKMLKPGGKIGNVNYLTKGDYIKIPRLAWGLGMGHKQINGGLMYGGRYRLEKYLSLIEYGRVDPAPLVTHRFEGLDALPRMLALMKEKPADLIKTVTVIK